MKVLYTAPDNPSWPETVADYPLKIGVNGLESLFRDGRVRCQFHVDADAAEPAPVGLGVSRPPPGKRALRDYAIELSWPEIARIARLHAEVVKIMAMEPKKRKKMWKRLAELRRAAREA